MASCSRVGPRACFAHHGLCLHGPQLRLLRRGVHLQKKDRPPRAFHSTFTPLHAEFPCESRGSSSCSERPCVGPPCALSVGTLSAHLRVPDERAARLHVDRLGARRVVPVVVLRPPHPHTHTGREVGRRKPPCRVLQRTCSGGGLLVAPTSHAASPVHVGPERVGGWQREGTRAERACQLGPIHGQPGRQPCSQIATRCTTLCVMFQLVEP